MLRLRNTPQEHRAKNRAHRAFDALWLCAPRGEERRARRAAAYAWLAQQMGKSLDATHISRFSVRECERVIGVCNARRYLEKTGAAP